MTLAGLLCDMLNSKKKSPCAAPLSSTPQRGKAEVASTSHAQSTFGSTHLYGTLTPPPGVLFDDIYTPVSAVFFYDTR